MISALKYSNILLNQEIDCLNKINIEVKTKENDISLILKNTNKDSDN